MPLDFNRIAATATGTVSDCHTYVKGIKTANFGEKYTKAFEGLKYYVVDSVAKPALQKVSELDYTKRATDIILKNKNVAIAVGAALVVVSFVLFVIWLHPSGKPSRIEGEGGSKAPGEIDEIDETDEEEEVDDDDLEDDEGGRKEGNYSKPPDVNSISIEDSINAEDIDVNDEEGDVVSDDDDEYEKEWSSSTSTATAEKKPVGKSNISKKLADNRNGCSITTNNGAEFVAKGQRKTPINTWNWIGKRNRQGDKNITFVSSPTTSPPLDLENMLEASIEEFFQKETPTSPTGTNNGTTLTVLEQTVEEKREDAQPTVKEKAPETKDDDKNLESKFEEDPSAGVNEQQIQTDNAGRKKQVNIDESNVGDEDSDDAVEGSDNEEEEIIQ